MNKTIFFAVLISFLFLPALIFADTGHGSVESILQEIKSSQNVNLNSDINCENIPDERWEELGDAVMGLMHPDEQQHELMDRMMGGEGSESLTAAHILMAKQYLGCASGVSGSGMMGSGMMGGGGMMGMGGGMMGMMGGNTGIMGSGSNYQNMMGWGGAGFGWNWFSAVFQVLILVLAVLGIAVLIKKLFAEKK